MSIETKHPDFLEVSEDFRVVRDAFAGERRIKEATFLYLPATTGQIKDGALKNVVSTGWISYSNYLKRAIFPEFVRDAANTLVGVMHAEPAVIKLPEALEGMRNDSTRKGETLEMLLRKINEQQLVFGRFGLLADFPQDVFTAQLRELPHIVQYNAETIINWDDERRTEFSVNELNFLVVNETVFVRGPEGANVFDWMEERRFRVLFLEELDPDFPPGPNNPLVYKTWAEADDVRGPTIIPQFMGSTLDEIPWVFVGANDLNAKPDEIPLLGIANLSLAVYRGEADYRQSLHQQGQDTLVIIGDEVSKEGDSKEDDDATEIGAGAIIRIVAGEGAKAEFIGVESKGIPEQRAALLEDRLRAQSMGARLLEPRGSQAESGEALRIRVAASTATLKTVALTGAAGLERILRICAKWVGADPDEVHVVPNLDFTQETPSPELARELGEAKKTGVIPLSEKSIHAWLQAKNYTKLTFEEEIKQLAAEKTRKVAFDAATAVTGRTDETGPWPAHSYVLKTWPDGSVHGITDPDPTDGHFHVITAEGVTEIALKHVHKLLKGVEVEREPEPAENLEGDPEEGDPENEETPGEENAGSSDEE